VNGLDARRIGPIRRLLPLGLVLLLAACGSNGGSTGSSSNAPTISNLRVSYSPSPPVGGFSNQVGYIVDVVDADGDWVLGVCRFVTGNILELPIQTSGLAANATSGTAMCFQNEVFTNTTVQIDMVVVDQVGHQSNVLSGLVNLEARNPVR
jgi:hypothetical protein